RRATGAIPERRSGASSRPWTAWPTWPAPAMPPRHRCCAPWRSSSPPRSDAEPWATPRPRPRRCGNARAARSSRAGAELLGSREAGGEAFEGACRVEAVLHPLVIGVAPREPLVARHRAVLARERHALHPTHGDEDGRRAVVVEVVVRGPEADTAEVRHERRRVERVVLDERRRQQ